MNQNIILKMVRQLTSTRVLLSCRIPLSLLHCQPWQKRVITHKSTLSSYNSVTMNSMIIKF